DEHAVGCGKDNQQVGKEQGAAMRPHDLPPTRHGGPTRHNSRTPAPVYIVVVSPLSGTRKQAAVVPDGRGNEVECVIAIGANPKRVATEIVEQRTGREQGDHRRKQSTDNLSDTDPNPY